jgi:predicted GIY-YIG superfamily endonuclease
LTILAKLLTKVSGVTSILDDAQQALESEYSKIKDINRRQKEVMVEKFSEGGGIVTLLLHLQILFL